MLPTVRRAAEELGVSAVTAAAYRLLRDRGVVVTDRERALASAPTAAVRDLLRRRLITAA